MQRSKSLFLKEASFFESAIDAAWHAGDHDNDDPNALHDTAAMVKIARRFLAQSAPELLDVLDDNDDITKGNDPKSAEDRLVKIGRCVSSTLRHARRSSSMIGSQLGGLTKEQIEDLQNGSESQTDAASSSANDHKQLYEYSKDKIDASLRLLADECSDLASLLKQDGAIAPVPKVRYGKTELQMPIITLGCMRFQQSWNRGAADTVTTMEQVEQECQDNLVHIIRHAVQCGVNHIETAKGYGSSQLQIGFALKTLLDAGEVKREDLIIQTKGGVSSSMTIQDYKQDVLKSIQTLQLDYVDLFSVHGLNTQQEYDLLFDNGDQNLIVALQELQAEGKIRHIGFSTHGPADLIAKAIDTDAFSYLNLHYHFCGSYTASGDDDTCGGNLNNVRLAHQKDMGIFIISAYDKGGRLYAPSNRLRDLCLPDMEPMTYGSAWLWQHAMHDEQNTPIHTFVVGAARPSDLDQPVLAANSMVENPDRMAERRERVTKRLDQAMQEALGEEWVKTWHHGLLNAHTSKYQTHHTGLVWAYNLIKAWGMLDFCKDRYGPMEDHLAKWSVEKSKEENIKSMGPGFGWMPGVAVAETLDYQSDFENVPEANKEKLMEAIQFVHEWTKKQTEEEKKNGSNKEIPLEWETAYDMRPWTAFPER